MPRLQNEEEIDAPEIEEEDIGGEINDDGDDVEAEEGSESAEEGESLIVQIGEEEPEAAEELPAWVKDMRRANREKEKRIKELEERLGERDPKPKLGPKPKLADFDYDEAKFESALDKWHADKRAAETEENDAAERQRQQNEAWQSKLSRFQEGRKRLGEKHFEEVDDIIRDLFNVTQQGIIVQGAKDPALLYLAIGRNPKKAQELSKVTDPIEFSGEVFRMEAALKVSHGHGKPAPERRIDSDKLGSGGAGSRMDKKLERLEAEAAKTGDRTEVQRYKRLLKERVA